MKLRHFRIAHTASSPSLHSSAVRSAFILGNSVSCTSCDPFRSTSTPPASGSAACALGAMIANTNVGNEVVVHNALMEVVNPTRLCPKFVCRDGRGRGRREELAGKKVMGCWLGSKKSAYLFNQRYYRLKEELNILSIGHEKLYLGKILNNSSCGSCESTY